MRQKGQLPELLAPAGSPTALRAAIEGGADAVYFGGPAFNARMRAQNFTADTMRESIALAHAYGVRAYVTLNTLATDRELKDFLAAADMAIGAGADALIIADPGGAALVRRAFPDVELHASTQASGHSIGAARVLADMGFSRMVLARETPARDMRDFVKNAGIETEVFIHGALCVSHSGQCLFSSLVGGRSGNRGECAQPCRLPDADGKYPLSLKDLCLARHIPDLIEMGVDSLKIEGRLKAPEYVRDVTAVYRRLLDGRRAANDAEMRYLADIFSRGGFTDAYFTESISRGMLGVRSDRDKERSRDTVPFEGITRRVSLDMCFSMKRNEPMRLSVKANGREVTVKGDRPFEAQNAPLDEGTVREKLSRLGGTPYAVGTLAVDMDEGLMVPISRLNALRRAALSELESLPPRRKPLPVTLRSSSGSRPARPTARFARADAIPPSAFDYFEHIYLPLDGFAPPADGVVLPPVIFDHETEGIRSELRRAVAAGARHALVGNLGHLALATEAGLVPHGDFRLNVTNSETLSVLLALGFEDVLLSPELTLPQIRDLRGRADAVIYGRIPLMTLEKCVGRELGGCDACHKGELQFVDRRGEKFPILRAMPHRNIILNSRPTVMSDRGRELSAAGVRGGHFIFTVESAQEAERVIGDYLEGRAPTGPVRRI
ncbi:MAG: U32 family peptidase [Ruminococcaceae bacterium]|nr:U32 family peptidase [Oscillospiraceae bacterium]